MSLWWRLLLLLLLLLLPQALAGSCTWQAHSSMQATMRVRTSRAPRAPVLLEARHCCQRRDRAACCQPASGAGEGDITADCSTELAARAAGAADGALRGEVQDGRVTWAQGVS